MTTYCAADPATRREDFLAWVREQGLTPGLIYQIDVADTEATVYEYKVDAEGKKYMADGDVARREPYTVQITTPPPVAPVLPRR